MIVFAQCPEITSWTLNLNGATNPSYPNYLTNVQNVCYTSTDMYVSYTCIAGYDIGPCSQNPNQPANQHFVFKISLSPQENTGKKTSEKYNIPLFYIYKNSDVDRNLIVQ